ncbi:MAG TPA: SRPBCC domain-containing protein [Steroidobacteraceae bacterium]|jgi:uncharacterized protein YndB with AHSA1/START domain|nr:SRPBCC domain-containing protein [Steroidobacteraceae bacterium]
MNASTQVPPVTVRHLVSAPATELFDDWLDPGKLAIWMRPADAKKAKVKVDPRVGGELDVVMHTKRRDLPHKGVYKVIDRPSRLAFAWFSPAAPDHESLVTIDFMPVGPSTEVTLTHENLAADDMVERHTEGWTRILELMSESYAKAA